MSTFNDKLLNNIRDVVDNVRKCLTRTGVYFPGRHIVYLVTVKRSCPDRAARMPGDAVYDKTVVDPSPLIEIRTQFRVIDNQTVKVGDAKFSNLSQNYTREQIDGADFFEIDGSAYKLVEGSLKDEVPGVFWSGTLIRTKVSGRTRP